MRLAVLVAWLGIARLVSATCLDDCQQLYGGSGPDYASCVQDCGVCGNGDLEGDEECDDGNLVNGDCCAQTSVEDFTDATGVVGFTGQPIGVPATVSVDDGQGGQASRPRPASRPGRTTSP